jgi:hypothetical protein
VGEGRSSQRHRRPLAIIRGLLVWCGFGALVAGLLGLVMSAGAAFAFSGLALVALSLGWAVGRLAVPAYAFVAGVLLVGTAGLLAAAG